ncbi:MAG: transcriptional regulator, partial [Flavipsychrobacter sp.]|nr:transcriptional regulator [Flavipsychrobacter sp.]
PKGGFILWLELAEHIDTYQLYQEAMQQKMSIAPGAMFTLQERYQNCMRLSYGMQWKPEVERALKKLGSIVKSMS